MNDIYFGFRNIFKFNLEILLHVKWSQRPNEAGNKS